jgi:hypothetical protein
MQVIPLTPQESLSFPVQLTGQSGGQSVQQQCKINLYQKENYGLFFDLFLNGSQIISAMLCLDRVGLVRQSYLGFIGQLAFVDTQGTNDPYYTDLGSRYILTYTP